MAQFEYTKEMIFAEFKEATAKDENYLKNHLTNIDVIC